MPHKERQSIESILKRSRRAWKVRGEWDSTLRDAYDLALPMRNLFNESGAGALKMDKVFDSTLMRGLVRFANKMQSQITPPFQKWANFLPGTNTRPDTDEYLERKRELAEIRDIVFSKMFVSNFDTAIHEGYLDLGIGTLAILHLQGTLENPFRYVPVPQTQIAIEEGGKIDIGAVFRKHKVKRRLIEPMWRDMFKKPDANKWDAWVKDNPDKDVQVVEATYVGEDEKTWFFDVILPKQGDLSASSSGDVRVAEADFNENPWIISRWIKVVGEAHGRGPVLYALPDAKTLNKVKEILLKNGSLSIAGIWTAIDDGVLNPYKVQIRPGAVIPVGRNAGGLGPSLMLNNMGQNLDLAQFLFSDLVNSIREAMMDNQLPGEESGIRSASEFVARITEGENDVGSPFARTFRELIRPLMQRNVNILVDMDILSENQRIKFDGADADIQITSPLAQLQNLKDVQNTSDFLTIANGAFNPQIVSSVVDQQEGVRLLADKMGVDVERLIRSREETAALEQEVGQEIALQQAAEAAAGGNGAQAPAEAAV